MSIKAVILCGGEGKRLRPLTLEAPKPMLLVQGKPMVEYQIMLLKKHGITDIIMCSGYKHEKVEKYFGNGSKWGVRIEHSIEKEALGTAGPVKQVESKLKDTFFVINGDTLTDLNITDMIKFHKTLVTAKGVLGTLYLAPLPSPYGIVDIDSVGLVEAFREKPLLHQHNINAGWYLLEPGILKYMPKKGSTEAEVFTMLAKEGKLAGYVHRGYWRDIGTVKDFEEVQKDRIPV